MTQTKKQFTGLAESLKIGNLFKHNESDLWEVVDVQNNPGATIRVTARYTTGSNRIKVFNFGKKVSL